MQPVLTLLEKVYLGAIVVMGVAWIVDLPRMAGIYLVPAEWMGPLLGIGIAAAYLRFPYGVDRGRVAGLPELLAGVVAIACWGWMAMNYNEWIIDIGGYTADKFVPGVIAIGLLMEAMRKAAGLPITILVWILIGYGLIGYLMPHPFQAERQPIPSVIMYVYADSNGVPGLVLTVVGTLVLAFIMLGKLMEVTGATKFFTDLALAGMGHRRGGPAKVAVIASSIFGSINGTAIGNIMSTGIVTIPLMKRSGFKPRFAGAIEAVASNGGQLAPPVMGATAFLIAEFLQVSYAEVVKAALVPALLYYICLFLQVDAIAARYGLHGLPKSELPRARSVLTGGWIFLLPLLVLVYLLFWRNFDPGLAALSAFGSLMLLAVIRDRRLPDLRAWQDLIVGGGANMLPLLMIAGGAGIVIGVMNLTGLGFSLSLILSQVGENLGLFVMLLMTGAISIVLGMGMPTTAIYVVLSVVLAPALVNMGISPMAAHLFIFYFGLLSFLTPPVAVASYVAAGLAGSGMWETSWEGVKLATVAYLLPFLWVYNQALILDGTTMEITYVIASAVVAAILIGRGMQTARLHQTTNLLLGVSLCLVALAVGSSTIWLGVASPYTLLVAGAGVALFAFVRRVQRVRDFPVQAGS